MRASLLIVSMAILIATVAAEEPNLQGLIATAKPFVQSGEDSSEDVSFQGIIAHAEPFIKPEESNSGSPSFEGLIAHAEPFVKSEEGNSEDTGFQGIIAHAEPFIRSETTQTSQPEVVSELPSTTIIYIGGTTIPLSSYQTDVGKYLWIEGDHGLYQYASINQYTTISLMAYTSTAGPGEILELYPSNSNQGAYLKTYYKFSPGYNRIPYRADVAGKHYLLFTMNNQPSNAIIIDVKGTDAPTILGTAPSNLNDQGISIDPIDQLNPQPEPPMPQLN